MSRTMYAAITRQGTACAETALCNECAGQGAVADPPPPDCDNGTLVDCGDNPSLICQNCDWTPGFHARLKSEQMYAAQLLDHLLPEQWREYAENTDVDLADFVNALNSLAERAARAARYFDMRKIGYSHQHAVEGQNVAGGRVRTILGIGRREDFKF